MQTELATQGKQLQHESHGLGRGRTLTIRMDRKATLGGIDVGGTPTKRAATFLDTTPDLVSGDWNTAGSSSPPRTGHVLGHVQGTPPKRPRSVPANVAAANAAMVRQALFQSDADPQAEPSFELAVPGVGDQAAPTILTESRSSAVSVREPPPKRIRCIMPWQVVFADRNSKGVRSTPARDILDEVHRLYKTMTKEDGRNANARFNKAMVLYKDRITERFPTERFPKRGEPLFLVLCSKDVLKDSASRVIAGTEYTYIHPRGIHKRGSVPMYGEAAYPAEVKELFTHKPPPTREEVLQQCREQIQKISSTDAEHPMVKSLTMQVEVCEENLKGWTSAKPKSFESKFFEDLMPDLFRTLIETREGVKRLLQGGKEKKSRGRPPDHFGGGGGGGAGGGAGGGGNNRSHSTGANLTSVTGSLQSTTRSPSGSGTNGNGTCGRKKRRLSLDTLNSDEESCAGLSSNLRRYAKDYEHDYDDDHSDFEQTLAYNAEPHEYKIPSSIWMGLSPSQSSISSATLSTRCDSMAVEGDIPDHKPHEFESHKKNDDAKDGNRKGPARSLQSGYVPNFLRDIPDLPDIPHLELHDLEFPVYKPHEFESHKKNDDHKPRWFELPDHKPHEFESHKKNHDAKDGSRKKCFQRNLLPT